MDITNSTTKQMDSLRRGFRAMNRFMVFLWKLGMGRMINFWPAVVGRIMVIKHRGRKSGKEYLTPVNYAPVNGEIYCTAGFGSGSDWYRNMQVTPDVELWLPEGKHKARAGRHLRFSGTPVPIETGHHCFRVRWSNVRGEPKEAK